MVTVNVKQAMLPQLSEDIIELPEDLIEEILQYCSTKDLKSISQCSKAMNQVAKELLWSCVAIPWKWLIDVEWESSLVMNQLGSLVYTTSLTFYHQPSDLQYQDPQSCVPQRDKDWEPLYAEKYLESFKKVVSHCDVGRLREFRMFEHEQLRKERGGALISHVCSALPNLETFCRKWIYEMAYCLLYGPFRDDALMCIRNLKSLRALDLTKTFLTPRTLVALFQHNVFNRLKVLNMRGTSINFSKDTYDDPSTICLPNVEELNISSSNCHDYLPFLTMSLLKSLDIGQTMIRDENVREITKLGNLEFLFMNGCNYVTDVGVEFISEMDSLRMVDLGFTRCTDKAISYLIKLSRLRGLSIQRSRYYTNKCVPFLTEMKSLVYFNFDESFVSLDAVSDVICHTSLKRLGTRFADWFLEDDDCYDDMDALRDIQLFNPRSYPIGELWRCKNIEKLLA